MLNRKLKGFTLAELMITLALSSILVSFSFLGLKYVQRLLHQFREQSYFITQLNELNKRLNSSVNNSRSIFLENDKKLIFRADSMNSSFEFKPDMILSIKSNQTDSFKVETKDLKFEYEPIGENISAALINKIEFNVYFHKQNFHLIFNKNYDAYSKFILETEKTVN